MDFNTPRIMGILNLTPDSFYDGGKQSSLTSILRNTESMLMDGADIIDIGAVSTRPGAKPVTEEEEISRLLDNVESLSKEFPEAIISIDTWRSNVARKTIEAGAHIINDISGGTFDDYMLDTIAELHVPYILMHIHGTPEDMQMNPIETDVVKKVNIFFTDQLKKLKSIGVSEIILDPGFGFGKSLKSNYDLLKNLNQIDNDNLPVLAGISRKSMINKILGTTPQEALTGTISLNTIALLNGANILRVHDVKEAREAISLYNYYIK